MSHSHIPAVAAQTAIGWESAVFGFWSPLWSEAQRKYYTAIKSRKTGTVWMRKVIMYVWDAAWSLWNTRNKHLHSNNTLNNYHPMDMVDDKIRSEFNKEPPRVIHPQYKPYFENRSIEQVMALSNFHRGTHTTPGPSAHRHLAHHRTE